MKRRICIFWLIGFSAANLLAQGRINFSNSSVAPLYIGFPGSFTVLGTASTATFGIGPASVRIQLYAGLTSSSLSPVLIGTGANQLYVTNTATTLAIAQGTFNGGSVLPLPGFDGTTAAFLQMFFTSINGTFYGQSSIIQVIPSLSPLVATPVFGAPGSPDAWDSADLWNGSSLSIGIGVPEPSAFALLGLGSASILALRRRP
jgi:hypothetical protein